MNPSSPPARPSSSYAPRAVAHVLASLALGGAERVAATLAAAQRRRGDRVTVVGLEPQGGSRLAEELLAAGVEVRTLDHQGGLAPTLALRLGALFRRERPDVVHTHNVAPLVHAAPVASLLGARTVHTKHGAHPAGAASLALRRVAAHFVDVFVAVSSDTAATARAQREPLPGTLTVIDNGIDLRPLAPDPAARRDVRAEWGLPLEAVAVGTVARLEPVKNHQGLLRAMAPLLGAGCRWIVVGDGSERRPLEATARALGVERWVVHLGERHDAARLYQGLDLFALASHSEGQPLAVLEAMAASVPVVATAVGGIPRAFEGAAVLVAANDEAALRSELARAIREPTHRGGLAARGAARVRERHSLEAMLAAYDRVYAAPALVPATGRS